MLDLRRALGREIPADADTRISANTPRKGSRTGTRSAGSRSGERVACGLEANPLIACGAGHAAGRGAALRIQSANPLSGLFAAFSRRRLLRAGAVLHRDPAARNVGLVVGIGALRGLIVRRGAACNQACGDRHDEQLRVDSLLFPPECLLRGGEKRGASLPIAARPRRNGLRTQRENARPASPTTGEQLIAASRRYAAARNRPPKAQSRRSCP